MPDKENFEGSIKNAAPVGRHGFLSGRLDIKSLFDRSGTGINTGNQTQHSEQCQQGGTAIADKGQGNTDNRHNTKTHANIAITWKIRADAAPKQIRRREKSGVRMPT